MPNKGYSVSGTPKIGLASATLGQFIGLATISLFGPSAIVFQSTMKLSSVQVALLVSVPVLFGSLLRIPFGAWADSSGARLPMLIVLGISTVFLGIISIMLLVYYPHKFTQQLYPALLVFGSLVGVGAAAFSIGVPQVSYWYPLKRQGYALGVYSGIGGLSPGIITLMLPFLITFSGIVYSYFIWFIISFIAFCIYFILAKDSFYFQLLKRKVEKSEAADIARSNGQELIPSYNTFKSITAPLKNKADWGLVITNLTAFGGYVSLTTWLPTYWAENYRFNIIQAGIITSIGFVILGTLIRLPAGSLSDRYTGEVVMFYSSLIMLAGSLMFLINILPLDLTGEFVLAIGTGVNSAATFKLVPKYSKNNVGGAAGLVSGLGVFSSLIITILLGDFVNIYGNSGYFLGFIIFIALSLVNIIISAEFFKKFHLPLQHLPK